ncbi:MAG: N6-adenine-specific DNA methylase [Bdellovibrionales bacterium RIFCSPHIGHO2_01_FULL_40_29]|nr:MAG: N6-adenine-specific DNA methylase [Bdellovibrionales bacterium RIFCSPHIGHO2_01_FULL_40_29]OFZ35287.1 MAG: N6-adenine-specific DNA methylase [Bdellovibrionales bacterium RIFCSPHIGHO2_02_FULL_40_15]
MATFFASCPTGMADLVETELKQMGLKTWEKTAGGVLFESNWAGCYKANLNSRYASRILKPILDFPAYQNEDIYHNILKHDFTKYIKPNQTLAVDASIKECAILDQRFLAMKVKDAVVDQFRDKFGSRPDVQNTDPDLRIHIRGYKNQYHVSIDTSGSSLFMRGYRHKTGEAPLKENLAAGLIGLAEWDRKTPIVDLFCGSGTILIEAAMMAVNMAPGLERKKFGFMNYTDFDADVWDQVVQEAIDNEKPETDVKFYGYDLDKKVLQMAKDNAKNAGVLEYIEFKSMPIATAHPPEGVETGLIIANPPYGARIGDEDNLKDVYRDLGYTLKHRFMGWTAWILSGNKELLSEMKLKATKKFFVFNGNIECRFLKYEMFEGSRRKPKVGETVITD